MTLEEDLQTIDGVGPKTAEKIVAIVEEHSTGETEVLEKANTFFEKGRPDIAESVVAGALDE